MSKIFAINLRLKIQLSSSEIAMTGSPRSNHPHKVIKNRLVVYSSGLMADSSGLMADSSGLMADSSGLMADSSGLMALYSPLRVVR